MAYPPTSSPNPGGALAAGIGMTLCCNLVCGILTIVFAAVAMSQHDPHDQDRFVRYAWTSFWIGLALGVVGWLIVFGAYS
ncbi:hypothetical protein [Streptomonospora litoralis]|uniref:Interferon-induced transmembrane protein n=1 Tax=Streptomonospora litoralis TaxID=2498135 RepID=A0A4V0ZJW0_9ACTN|nr:hypothetical protein [Streptomonospora litoralis]QBI54852.1 hypothetical protein EKD16_15375 [Streptomonospora litoralis]